MKVCYVSHTSLMSGAEGALLDLLAALPSDVDAVVACPPGTLARSVRSLGLDVTYLRPVSGSFRGGALQTSTAVVQMLGAAWAMRRLLAQAKPDLVHANTVRAGLVCSAALLGSRTPLFVHCHDALPRNRQAHLVRAVQGRAATAILTISDYAADGLVGGRSGPPITVLHNPLDTARFDPARLTREAARATIGFAPDDQLLGVFAQITPWKGQEVAIRAVGQLRERHPKLRLLIVGEAKFTSPQTRFDNLAYVGQLYRLITELGIEANVEFWGERADVDVLMRAVDVALTPSWAEPFGRSVIEAMALETPVVATSVGGPAEYIEDGVDGLLVAPTDVDAWCRAIERLLASPEASATLGRRASEKVRARFDRDVYVARIHKLYEAVAP